MKKALEKAINLAKITKDKIIVVDVESDKSFVVIDLAEYERLLLRVDKKEDIKNLTENELLDKINRDIAFWKEENQIEEIESAKGGLKGENNVEGDIDFKYENEEDLNEEEEEENLYYYEENAIKDSLDNFNRKNSWKISPGIKDAAEDIE